MAEITQEQEITERCEAVRLALIGWYGSEGLAKHMSTGDSPARMVAALKAAIPALARIATPELVALGEAAVNYAAVCDAHEDPLDTHDADAALLEAARLYAQSIKGEDHGK